MEGGTAAAERIFPGAKTTWSAYRNGCTASRGNSPDCAFRPIYNTNGISIFVRRL